MQAVPKVIVSRLRGVAAVGLTLAIAVGASVLATSAGAFVYVVNQGGASISQFSGATGAPVAGVKVSFMLGKGVLCSAMTNAAGTAACVKHGAGLILSPPPRYHAVFAGNADYAPSHVRGKLREPCPGIGICVRKLK